MTKKAQRGNALKHGAFSQQTLLWGETQEEYDAFRAAVYAEWQPEGPTEENLVEGLLNLLWRARRYRRHEQIEDQKKLEAIHERNEHIHHVEKLCAFIPHFSKAAAKEDVEKVFADLPAAYADAIRSKWPLKENEDPNKWGDKIAKGLTALNMPRKEGADEFLAMSDPIEFVMSLRVTEPLDAKIEQITKRLVQLKAAKQALKRLEPRLVNTAIPKEQALIRSAPFTQLDE